MLHPKPVFEKRAEEVSQNPFGAAMPRMLHASHHTRHAARRVKIAPPRKVHEVRQVT